MLFNVEKIIKTSGLLFLKRVSGIATILSISWVGGGFIVYLLIGDRFNWWGVVVFIISAAAYLGCLIILTVDEEKEEREVVSKLVDEMDVPVISLNGLKNNTTICEINGKRLEYNLALVGYINREEFKYLGKGFVYSINGVRQISHDSYHFYADKKQEE